MMKIISAEVDMMEKWVNDPELKVTVDKMPPSDEFVYKKHVVDHSTTLYFAHHESGVCRYFAHSRGDQSGYGGRSFELKMADGITEIIKGPWSSRSSVMNRYFSPECVEVILYERDGMCPTLGYASNLTIELAQECARMAGHEFVRRRDGREPETGYVIPKVKP